jgi:hypothetical protein
VGFSGKLKRSPVKTTGFSQHDPYTSQAIWGSIPDFQINQRDVLLFGISFIKSAMVRKWIIKKNHELAILGIVRSIHKGRRFSTPVTLGVLLDDLYINMGVSINGDTPNMDA